MPLSLTHAIGSGVINAVDIENNVDKIETFINGGTNATDYDTNFVDSTHIRPPEFFGSPAPRTELVSSDVHYRKTGIENVDAFRLWADIDVTDFVPIIGMATTIHVMPPVPGDMVEATVLCNWYSREISFGQDTLDVSNETNLGKYVFATFGLFVKHDDGPGIFQVGTMRQLHAAGDLRIYAQNYSLTTKVNLQTGINHVYVGAKIDPNCPASKAYRLLVGPRTLIVDVHYL
jgi:hypothetical protein